MRSSILGGPASGSSRDVGKDRSSSAALGNSLLGPSSGGAAAASAKPSGAGTTGAPAAASIASKTAAVPASAPPSPALATYTLIGHTLKVRCLSWAADGSFLCSGSEDGSIRVWMFVDGKPSKEVRVLRGHTGPVSTLHCFPKPFGGSVGSIPPACLRRIISTGHDSTLRVWDVSAGPGGKQEQSSALPERAYTAAWRLDGDIMAVGTQRDEILLLDVSPASVDSRKVAIVGRHPLAPGLQLNDLAWTPTGLLFGVAGWVGGITEEGLVLILRVARDGSRADLLGQLQAHTSIPYCLRFDPTFKMFATGGEDSIVCLWDTDNLTCVRTCDRLETIIRGVSFSHTGEYLATASDDRVIEIIRVVDGCRVRGLPVTDRVDVVCWAPSASKLAYVVDDKSTRSDAHAVKVVVL